MAGTGGGVDGRYGEEEMGAPNGSDVMDKALRKEGPRFLDLTFDSAALLMK